MKTKILTTVLLCFFFLSYAQHYEYVPFVNEGVVWSYCDVVSVGSDEYDLKYSQYNFSGDTIINDRTYKKLFKHDCSSNGLYYIASMREEGKKVYTVYSGDLQEKLIYNFGLAVGDSMQSPYDDTYYYRVIKIDTIEVASVERKRIQLDFDTWIEGIGTLDRFMMYPLQAIPLYELGIRINYQKQGVGIIYKTNEWYLNENDCNFSSADVPGLNKTVVYFITPELLKVETESPDTGCTVELFDLNGISLGKNSIDRNNTTINVGQLPDGLYVVRLFRKGEVCFIGKISK